MARTNAQKNIQAIVVALIVAACFGIGLYGGELAAAAASENVTFVSSSAAGGGTVTIRVLTSVNGETVVDHYEERPSGLGDVVVRVEDSKVTIDGLAEAPASAWSDDAEDEMSSAGISPTERQAGEEESIELVWGGPVTEVGAYSSFHNLIKSYVRAAFSA